ncbi:hypothetical protein [Prevotella sp. S7-1-8]|uniref:hypothetical protein n=1 Tax=Prevotella sp. S7-1-8 TaxID=1284775 RepID=UPI0012E0A12A|nr:hypothetical protein [Prevotella sp. S7-1-8]
MALTNGPSKDFLSKSAFPMAVGRHQAPGPHGLAHEAAAPTLHEVQAHCHNVAIRGNGHAACRRPRDIMGTPCAQR